MLITTLHETIFEYDRPIRGTFTQVCLWPVSDASQTCREFSLTVDPMRPMTESADYHGNRVLTFNILPEHRRVVVTGRSPFGERICTAIGRNPVRTRSPLN